MSSAVHPPLACACPYALARLQLRYLKKHGWYIKYATAAAIRIKKGNKL